MTCLKNLTHVSNFHYTHLEIIVTPITVRFMIKQTMCDDENYGILLDSIIINLI